MSVARCIATLLLNPKPFKLRDVRIHSSGVPRRNGEPTSTTEAAYRGLRCAKKIAPKARSSGTCEMLHCAAQSPPKPLSYSVAMNNPTTPLLQAAVTFSPGRGQAKPKRSRGLMPCAWYPVIGSLQVQWKSVSPKLSPNRSIAPSTHMRAGGRRVFGSDPR